MKFDDGTLKNYLIKTLHPLTPADPSILANYVLALLKNNNTKPKKELQKLCVDKLFEFIGDETKQFVSKLFHELEDGSLSDAAAGGDASDIPKTGDAPEILKTADAPDTPHKPPHEENESSDEDDDRNHKHRRRVSRSRSSDREEGRSQVRKRSRSSENGHYRDSHRIPYENRRLYRTRDQQQQQPQHSLGSRIVVDGTVHGGTLRTNLLSGPRYLPGRIGPRFPDGPDILASASSIFSRVGGGRGGPSWNFGGLIGNGALDVLNPLNHGRGSSLNLSMSLPRPRCPDFEEQGYCLRGDLCPMDHGANRIVVDDVQSLSKLTLPLRNGGSAPSNSARSNRDSGENPTVSETYDPDQPLWVKHSEQQHWENDNKTASKRQRIEEHEEGTSININGNIINGTQKQKILQNNSEGSGKAQRTLYVRCLPAELNKTETLRSYFSKFGDVLDIRIPPHYTDRAFIQFSKREHAEAAILSPEAVFGNRFIRVSWANRDNRVDPREKAAFQAGNGSKAGNEGTPVVAATGNDGIPGISGEVKSQQQVASTVTQQQVASSVAQQQVASTAAQQQMASAVQKKQEELEQMKEEIRKKQEALAAKRDEFKRRLKQLEKQSTTTPASVPKVSTSPFPRTAQQHNRYRIDNRTTTFKILTPSTALPDIEALRAHFTAFGEATVENVNEVIEVHYGNRRDAERAFTEGKLFQGETLQFAWMNIPQNLAQQDPTAPVTNSQPREEIDSQPQQ